MSSEESPDRRRVSRFPDTHHSGGSRSSKKGFPDTHPLSFWRSGRRPYPLTRLDRLVRPPRLGRRGIDRHRTTGDSAAPGGFCDAPNGHRPKFWKITHFLSGQTDPIRLYGKIGIVALVEIRKVRILYVVQARRLRARFLQRRPGRRHDRDERMKDEG
jgi:hypothetical protein